MRGCSRWSCGDCCVPHRRMHKVSHSNSLRRRRKNYRNWQRERRKKQRNNEHYFNNNSNNNRMQYQPPQHQQFHPFHLSQQQSLLYQHRQLHPRQQLLPQLLHLPLKRSRSVHQDSDPSHRMLPRHWDCLSLLLPSFQTLLQHLSSRR